MKNQSQNTFRLRIWVPNTPRWQRLPLPSARAIIAIRGEIGGRDPEGMYIHAPRHLPPGCRGSRYPSHRSWDTIDSVSKRSPTCYPPQLCSDAGRRRCRWHGSGGRVIHCVETPPGRTTCVSIIDKHCPSDACVRLTRVHEYPDYETDGPLPDPGSRYSVLKLIDVCSSFFHATILPRRERGVLMPDSRGGRIVSIGTSIHCHRHMHIYIIRRGRNANILSPFCGASESCKNAKQSSLSERVMLVYVEGLCCLLHACLCAHRNVALTSAASTTTLSNADLFFLRAT